MKMKKRSMSSLAKKRRKAQAKANRAGLILESLEERQMLTASWSNFGASTGASEFNGSGTHPTIEFSPATTATTTVQLQTTTPLSGGGVTAAESSDFSLSSFSVPAGTTSIDLITGKLNGGNTDGTKALVINNDQLVEGTEAIGLQILGSTVGVQGTTTMTHQILDNETATIEIGDAINEGTSGATVKLKTGYVSGQVEKNGNNDKPVFLEEQISVVVKDIVNGTATVGNNSGDDVFPFTNQTVFFGQGLGNNALGFFTVQTRSDSILEGTETVSFTLDPAPNYVGTGTNVLKINDAQTVSVSFINNPTDPSPFVSVEDANSGDVFVDVILNLPQGGTLTEPLEVPVTIGGTATRATAPLSNPNPNGDRDYTIEAPTTPTLLTFPTGSGNGARITYEIDAESGLRDDAILEGNETVTLQLGKPRRASDGVEVGTVGNGNYGLTIVDDEVGNIKVERVAENVNEGAGSVQYKFTVTHTGSSSVLGVGPVTIPYTLTGSTTPQVNNPPKNDDPVADYNQLASGTFTVPFSSGTSSIAFLSIPLNDDNIVEGDETVTINVANPTIGLSVTGSGATTTIKDNDAGTVNVNVLDSTDTSKNSPASAATEDDCAFGSVDGKNGAKCTSDDARFEITLSNPSSTDTIVQLKPTGTASSNSDYVAFPTSVTIPAGATKSSTFTLQILDDSTVEGIETIGIKIDKITSADPQISIGNQESFINIFDSPVVDSDDLDKATLNLTASDPIASESTTSGVDNGQFLFQLSQLVGSPVVVNYTVSGNAGAGVDYQAISNSVTIPANSFGSVVNVQVIDDNIDEGNETVTVTINSVSASGITVSTTGNDQLTWTSGDSDTVTISDDDGVNISVVTKDGSAGEDGSPNNSNEKGPGQLEVTLSNASTQTVSAKYKVTGSPVANSSDFSNSIVNPTLTTASTYGALLGEGTITFQPGQTKYVFNYNVVDDSQIEGTEQVVLTLSDPTNGSIGTAAGTVNVIDNDSTGANVAAVIPATPENGPANDTTAAGVRGKFDFTLPSSSTSDTTVFFTLGGTASNNVDYTIFTEDPATKANPAVLSLSGNAGSIVIPKNTTGPKSLWVVGKQDVFVEGNEGVLITLTGTSNASIKGEGNATVFISDDDAALVSITAVDDKAFENPSAGGNTAAFQLTVNNPNVARQMLVQYNLVGSSNPAATQPHGNDGGDVNIGNTTTNSISSGFITVNPFVTSVFLPITAINDSFVEGTEDLVMQLTGIISETTLAGVGFDPSANNAKAEIIDDDSGAQVFLSFQDLTDQTASEENTADKVPIFIGLTQPSSQPTTVRFSTGGSGIAADAEFNNVGATNTIGHDDYVIVGATPDGANFPNPLTGRYEYTIVIPAFESSAVFEVMAIDDDPGSSNNNPTNAGMGVVEGDEVVNIRLGPDAAPNFITSQALSQINPTIVETDVARIRISDHDSTTNEAGSSVVESNDTEAIITVLSDIEGELDVFYQYVDGTATAANDYNNFGGGVAGSFVFVNTIAGTTNQTIAPGQPLEIDLKNDSVFEGKEKFQIQLFATHNNNGRTDQLGFGVGDFASVEIIDDDQISLSVSNTHNENNQIVPVTVNINGNAPTGLYTISTGGGTATSGADYTGFSGTANWNGTSWTNASFDTDGDATLEFNVAIKEDTIVEGNQTFDITVTPPNNSVATPKQTITIVDEDTAKIVAKDVSLDEGAAVGSVLEVTTDKQIEGNLTFDIDVVAVTATEDTNNINGDFNPFAKQGLTLTGNGPVFSSNVISTAGLNDTVLEGNETATIQLTNIKFNGKAPNEVNANLDINNGTFTVQDDVETVTFEVNPSNGKLELTEGAAASVKVKLKLQNASSSVPITVNPVTSNLSATGGSDFIAIAAGGQPLNFSGSNNQELTAVVSTIDDNVIEATEKFNITFPLGDITTNAGANIPNAPSSVEVTVKDNDSAGVEIRGEVDGTEGGNDGSFVVGLTNGKVSDVDIFVSLNVSGSATAITDYDLSTPPPFLGAPFSTTAPSYIAVIPANSTGAVVTVDIVDDAIVESAETVTVTENSVIPAAPRNISGTGDSGTVVINDDDGVSTPSTFAVSGTTWNAGPATVANGANLPWRGINRLHVGFSGSASPPTTLTIVGTTPTSAAFSATLQGVVGGVGTYAISGLTSDLPSGRYRVISGGTTVLNFEVAVADGTLDGSIGFGDFAAMAAAFGTATGAGASPSVHDYDANGSVGFSDFALLAANFGVNVNGYPSPAPPSSPAAVDDVFADSDDDDNIFG